MTRSFELGLNSFGEVATEDSGRELSDAETRASASSSQRTPSMPDRPRSVLQPVRRHAAGDPDFKE
jgi:hypothetical protein